MAKKALILVNNFISRLNALEMTRAKIENYSGTGVLVRRDVEKVYEALYLKAFTEFESLIENLFIGLLTKRLQAPSNKVILRVVFSSDKVAREIVYGGRNYIDWFPYRKTEELAAAFFRGGRPFTNLDKVDKQELDKMIRIRNAIAHNSTYAKRSFEDSVIGSTPLMPRERTPAGYLRSTLSSVSVTQTRFQHVTIQMVGMTRKLCC